MMGLCQESERKGLFFKVMTMIFLNIRRLVSIHCLCFFLSSFFSATRNTRVFGYSNDSLSQPPHMAEHRVEASRVDGPECLRLVDFVCGLEGDFAIKGLSKTRQFEALRRLGFVKK